jgi:RNA polymerase primary sigma factor
MKRVAIHQGNGSNGFRDPLRRYLAEIEEQGPVSVAEGASLVEAVERHRTGLRDLLVEAGRNRPRRSLDEIAEATQRLLAARRRLSTRYLGEVVPIARRYASIDSPAFLDLLQEGSTALVRAVERYRPNAHGAFREYARSRIRDAIRRHATDGSRLIRGLDADPVSLDEPIDGTEDRVVGDLVPDPDAPDPAEWAEGELLRARIEEVLRGLSVRERNVLRLRFGLGRGHPHSLEEVARILRVSRRRIRQIQGAAIRKLALPEHRTRLEGFLPPVA